MGKFSAFFSRFIAHWRTAPSKCWAVLLRLLTISRVGNAILFWVAGVVFGPHCKASATERGSAATLARHRRLAIDYSRGRARDLVGFPPVTRGPLCRTIRRVAEREDREREGRSN